jgi:DNA-binding transcriptional LysR family regulator
MVNLNQLRVFYEAARCENFTLAAKKLFITQPAVTAQIKIFEDQCNLKLFKKKGRNIFLTDEGRTLYNYTRKIFEWEKEIENLIDDMRDLKRGILRLGVNKTYARYFMPFLITGFREAYPHVKIHLDEGSSLDMIYSLRDLRNELAVIAKVGDHPDVCFIPFSQEEIVLTLNPEHPLATRTAVSVEELAEEPIIMKEAGSGTRKLVNELFELSCLTPNILMETSNTEFIKELVQRGDGVSFIVEEAVTLEVREKKLAAVSIEGRRILLDVSIAYLEDQPLSPAAKAFLDILLKITPKESSDHGIRAIMNQCLAQWKGNHKKQHF